MSAVMVAVVVRDGLGVRRVERVPALATATPGVFLRRRRVGEACEPGECGHLYRHRCWYEVCPDRAWSEWVLTLACGVALMPGLALPIVAKSAAHELAAALARWPVDWAAPEPVLQEWAATPAAREGFGRWLLAAAVAAARGGRLPAVPAGGGLAVVGAMVGLDAGAAR